MKIGKYEFDFSNRKWRKIIVIAVIALIVLIAFFQSCTAEADTGFYHDPDRDGEGIIVTIADGRMALALFTYWDSPDGNIVPPVVSPAPPYQINTLPCIGCPVWYVGTAEWKEDIGIGNLKMSMAIDYPFVVGDRLDDNFTVGRFVLFQNGDGFEFFVACNDTLNLSMYLCSEEYFFSSKIIGD